MNTRHVALAALLALGLAGQADAASIFINGYKYRADGVTLVDPSGDAPPDGCAPQTGFSYRLEADDQLGAELVGRAARENSSLLIYPTGTCIGGAETIRVGLQGDG